MEQLGDAGAWPQVDAGSYIAASGEEVLACRPGTPVAEDSPCRHTSLRAGYRSMRANRGDSPFYSTPLRGQTLGCLAWRRSVSVQSEESVDFKMLESWDMVKRRSCRTAGLAGNKSKRPLNAHSTFPNIYMYIHIHYICIYIHIIYVHIYIHIFMSGENICIHYIYVHI